VSTIVDNENDDYDVVKYKILIAILSLILVQYIRGRIEIDIKVQRLKCETQIMAYRSGVASLF
jgi:hypothetical protein